METTVVIVRHAHRETRDRDSDNGISDKGREQVKKLEKSYLAGKIPEGFLFWSSPKVRCQETLKSLSELAGRKLITEPLLDEQNSDEGRSAFEKRLEKAVVKIESQKKTLYLCSHGDVIPSLIEILSGTAVELDKAGFAILKKQGANWKLL